MHLHVKKNRVCVCVCVCVGVCVCVCVCVSARAPAIYMIFFYDKVCNKRFFSGDNTTCFCFPRLRDVSFVCLCSQPLRCTILCTF